MVAYRLGVAGKPYSDEPVKACIVNAVMCIHPGKENEYSSIPLSRDTMQRRQYNIADQLKHSLQKMVNNEGSLFSLAVDESTDITDSAQLLIFVRSLSPSFELCEGLVARFSNYVPKEHGNKQLINLHCIIHQETLCSKIADLDNILKDVNRKILFVRANALHHRQFLEILRAKESNAENILYHSDVRWLSQGETSHRVPLVRKEIVEFYFCKNKDCPLQNSDFLILLAFLVDLLSHVNHLNQALPGRAASVCLLFQKVQDFCDKCHLLKSHLQQRNFYHFQQLKALIDSKEIRPDDIPTNFFSGVIDVLLKKFSERFKDFEKISVALRLVAFPHLVAAESAPLDLQMELVELKNNEPLIKKFEEKYDLVETWKVVVDYPKLRELARNILILFKSTCMCEAAFSRMKYLKHKYRTRLANDNL
ncbi:General transcription factor II-I repeat domain-containing protein 2B [Trichinella zimbabwensis]|uniref:General transcription factor II-I repeat domain-containing protein 2B n=1 Tax=Trichinella zimbabwensis TaxID=268475 RepID=A0A0V1GRQ5_9BILA|nr:General transcription factor II-I repeat domain-containing protein 2B [Trichinella zimbabwensis]